MTAKFDVSVERFEKTISEIEEFRRTTEESVTDGLFEAAQVLMDNWLARIGTTEAEDWYDTGALRASKYVKEISAKRVDAGFDVEYAQQVEDYHPRSPKLLANTYASSLPDMEDAFRRQVEDSLNGGGPTPRHLTGGGE